MVGMEMAYAAVVSLKQTIEHLLSPSQTKVILSNSDLKLIHDDLCYLQSFLGSINPSQINQRVYHSQKQIIKVAPQFGFLINFHVRDRFLTDSERMNLVVSRKLIKVRAQINSLTKTLKIEEDCNREDRQKQSDPSASCTLPLLADTTATEKKIDRDERDKLLCWISSINSKRDVMLVVGMAGIGKTALVEQVYLHPFVSGYFRRFLFLRIGPRFQLKEILLLALDQLGVQSDNGDEESLGEYVYRSLERKSYLIVLDDMWSSQAWNELQRFFPDDDSGSRIILTSRLLDFADRASIAFAGNTLQKRFLNDGESWDLLCEVVFTTEEQCDSQLAKIGRKIAKNCEGLPLAIIEVGKLLRKIERTVEQWKMVADKEDPITITRDDETPLSKAIYLSYRMLPRHLKVYLLYMSVFPKDYVIFRTKLMKLCVSEDFLQLQNSKSLEETAAEYLDELVSYSVVLVNQFRSIDTRTAKTCKLHFTFRSLCVNEATRENVFHIINKYPDSLVKDIDSQQRRLCIHNNIVLGFEQVHQWMESVPDVKSLLCFGPRQQYPIVLYLNFPLLKVLDALAIRFYEFPNQVLELVHLKYLAITCDGELPASVSCLGNLEVLIVNRHHIIKSSNAPVHLPIEIWKLYKLKHLQCVGLDLLDPSSTCDSSLVLDKLLTLSGVTAHTCTRGILARLPSLMKIGIKIESAHDSVETFSFVGHFASLYQEFESFKCVLVNPNLGSIPSLSNFPNNIKKISLSGCGFPWEYMNVIAALPNLEALKLRCYAFRGPEWKMCDGKFLKLKFLLMEDLDIQHWGADSNHLPLLQRLTIRHCYKLRVIPPFIGFLLAFEMIEVEDCSPSVVASAKHVEYEQSSLDNEIFQVREHSSWTDKKFKSLR